MVRRWRLIGYFPILYNPLLVLDRRHHPVLAPVDGGGRLDVAQAGIGYRPVVPSLPSQSCMHATSAHEGEGVAQ
jgi:hypothetical protein